MVKRVLSALIGGPILLVLTWLGGWYLTLLIVVLALLAFREFISIGQKAGLATQSKLMGLFCVLCLATFLFHRTEWLLSVGFIGFIFTFGNYAIRYPLISLADATYGFLAFFYPLGLLTNLYYLRELPHGASWCFFVFLLVWVTDSGAFFVGSAIGKRKLAPNVSPNKSIEGAVGGVLAACCFGFVFWLIAKEGSLPAILFLSILTSIVAQIGDLFESALKRTAGVKDSGNVIPGHGGILDRFDSFLFAIPIVYLSLILGLVG